MAIHDRHGRRLRFENDLRPVAPLQWGGKKPEIDSYVAKLAEVAKEAHVEKFDENEPRDDTGKWTAGGSHEQLRDAAWAAADKLGFPKARVVVTDEEYPFTLNGKNYKAAGSADINSQHGVIKIYRNQITPEAMSGVMAHEVSHMKFADAQRKYQAEKTAIEAEPTPEGKDIYDTVLRPSGAVRDEYKEKYAHYQAMHDSLYAPTSATFAQSDGVSEYSKQYWEGYHKGEVSMNSAMHETLAEMHRIVHETGIMPKHEFSGPLPRHNKSKEFPQGFATTRGIPSIVAEGTKAWRKLYKVVHK